MVLRVSVSSFLEENCYFYIDEATNSGFMIDPGAEAERLLAIVRKNSWKIEKILLTHGHFDHFGAADKLSKELSAPVYSHESSASFLLDPELNLSARFAEPITLSGARYFSDGDLISLSASPEHALRVIHTPGHSPDSVLFYSESEGLAFAGDTIFKQKIGNYDFPGGSMMQLIQSIRSKVLTLPGETVLYSGHTEETTVAAEKRFLGFK